MDPRIQIRIRIHSKMSWIHNTALNIVNSAPTQRGGNGTPAYFMSYVSGLQCPHGKGDRLSRRMGDDTIIHHKKHTLLTYAHRIYCVVKNCDIEVLIVNNPRKVLCFNLWERFVSKIREKVCEEEILHAVILLSVEFWEPYNKDILYSSTSDLNRCNISHKEYKLHGWDQNQTWILL